MKPTREEALGTSILVVNPSGGRAEVPEAVREEKEPKINALAPSCHPETIQP